MLDRNGAAVVYKAKYEEAFSEMPKYTNHKQEKKLSVHSWVNTDVALGIQAVGRLTLELRAEGKCIQSRWFLTNVSYCVFLSPSPKKNESAKEEGMGLTEK